MLMICYPSINNEIHCVVSGVFMEPLDFFYFMLKLMISSCCFQGAGTRESWQSEFVRDGNYLELKFRAGKNCAA